MDGRFQNLILFATVIFSLNLCEPAECTTEAPPVYCEADDVIDAEQVPYYVDILLNPEVTFDEVCYSEKMLATGPIEVVFEGLLPLLEFHYTEREICLGGDGPQGFSLCPYPWPSARAAFRVVHNFLNANSGRTSADLTRRLLRDDEYRALFPFLIHYLEDDWNEESDSLVLSLFENSAADYRTRRYAAGTLLRMNPWRHYELVLEVCENAREPLRSPLVEVLVSSKLGKRLGPDVRIIRLALEVMGKSYYVAPVDLRASYSMALCLRSYLKFESALTYPSVRSRGNVVLANLRFRREIEESIAQARDFLRESEESGLTNAAENDSSVRTQATGLP